MRKARVRGAFSFTAGLGPCPTFLQGGAAGYLSRVEKEVYLNQSLTLEERIKRRAAKRDRTAGDDDPL